MSSMSKKRNWSGSAFTQLEKNQSTNNPGKTKRLDRCYDSIPSTSRISNGSVSLEQPVENQPNKNMKLSIADWINSFAPTDVESIALHPKKLAELQSWLQHCDATRQKNPAQICLLSGPSGSSKTTAAKLIAKEHHYQLQEWINPVDRDVITTLGDQDNSYIGSQIEAFKSFLLRASRYKSVLSTDKNEKRLLMIEDFPNTLLKDPMLLEELLDEYVKYGRSPLIFIVADSKSRSLNIVYNLFTDHLKSKFQITHICFNPIATTILQKAMKRFCVVMRNTELAENYAVPTQQVLDSIVICAQGDVRNALINLHFASLKGTIKVATEKLETDHNKDRKSKKTETKLKSIGRDESITIMHAIGRVLNPGRKATGDFVHSPEDICESFATEPNTFLNLLHANYLSRFSDVEYVLGAADALSLADNIMMEYRDDSIATTALNIAVRGLMDANKTPVKGWIPVRAARRLNRNQSTPQLSGVSSSLFATEYNTYVRQFSFLHQNQKNSLNKSLV